MSDGAFPDRLTQLRNRWEADPSSRIFLQLAEEYRHQGRIKEALAVLDRGLREHPGYLSALVAKGRCHLELGEPEAARGVLERVVKQDATQMVANKLLVRAYLDTGEADKARERLDLYSLLNDSDPEIEELRRRLRAMEQPPRPHRRRTALSRRRRLPRRAEMSSILASRRPPRRSGAAATTSSRWIVPGAAGRLPRRRSAGRLRAAAVAAARRRGGGARARGGGLPRSRLAGEPEPLSQRPGRRGAVRLRAGAGGRRSRRRACRRPRGEIAELEETHSRGSRPAWEEPAPRLELRPSSCEEATPWAAEPAPLDLRARADRRGARAFEATVEPEPAPVLEPSGPSRWPGAGRGAGRHGDAGGDLPAAGSSRRGEADLRRGPAPGAGQRRRRTRGSLRLASRRQERRPLEGRDLLAGYEPGDGGRAGGGEGPQGVPSQQLSDTTAAGGTARCFLSSLSRISNRIEGARRALPGRQGRHPGRVGQLRPRPRPRVLAAELVAQARVDLATNHRELDVGEVQQLSVTTDRLTLMVSSVAADYYLLLVLGPEGNYGKARFELRRARLLLEADLS